MHVIFLRESTGQGSGKAPNLPAMLYRARQEIFMQTAQVEWIGDQKFVAISPSGHAITLDADGAVEQSAKPHGVAAHGAGSLHGG